jgi:hypothetical protein
LDILLHGFDGLFRCGWGRLLDAAAARERQNTGDRRVHDRNDHRRQPRRDRRRQQGDQAGCQGTKGQQGDDGGADQQAGAGTQLLALLRSSAFARSSSWRSVLVCWERSFSSSPAGRSRRSALSDVDIS